ncbi:MAG TPA: amidase [Gemmatimonadaceae bacterium]|nr:amidase [Gemmatimonadaceae bacterium]
MNSSPHQTAGERLDAALAAIAEHQGRTNAFILVDEPGARAAARTVDDERRRGVDRGPLHGMPISIKDLIDIAGQPTTAASRVRAGHVATTDAPVVQRLREAGAVLIGKTNLHEFAIGTTSDESAFGAVHNPHDVSRSAGGSSGGSAAAVACGMGDASIGSDTGGSIRIPAAACGVVGLKPSLGEVPTEGAVPLSFTFDHLGPLTRSVDDAAALWAVLTGRRPEPIDVPAPGAVTLGVLGGYFDELLDSEVRAGFAGALERLERCGLATEARSIANTELITAAYVAISLAEAAHWHASNLQARSGDYQPGVRARLAIGEKVLATEYLAAFETRAQLRRAVDAALEGCDALVLPTLAIVAPTLGTQDVTMSGGQQVPVRSAMLRLTQLFNVTGHPAISIPVPTSGLPIGLQLVGRRDQTAALLATALACEQALM